MRLINIHTFELRAFNDANVPPYIITSHRWGDDEATLKALQRLTKRHTEEEILTDYNRGTDNLSEGLCKVVGCCMAACTPIRPRRSTPDWLWIDTCCINHGSDAEVSESINSMCKWYGNAAYCLAYLKDVRLGRETSGFDESEWFRRGWTLQELVVPREVFFLDVTWVLLGSKSDPELLSSLTHITRIPGEVLRDFSKVQQYSAEAKFQWAQNRQTTKEEDMAYCLLGIFGVHLSLIYGEGRANAERRLRAEIRKRGRRSNSYAAARVARTHRRGENEQWSHPPSASQALDRAGIEQRILPSSPSQVLYTDDVEQCEYARSPSQVPATAKSFPGSVQAHAAPRGSIGTQLSGPTISDRQAISGPSDPGRKPQSNQPTVPLSQAESQRAMYYERQMASASHAPLASRMTPASRASPVARAIPTGRGHPTTGSAHVQMQTGLSPRASTQTVPETQHPRQWVQGAPALMHLVQRAPTISGQQSQGAPHRTMARTDPRITAAAAAAAARSAAAPAARDHYDHDSREDDDDDEDTESDEGDDEDAEAE